MNFLAHTFHALTLAILFAILTCPVLAQEPVPNPQARWEYMGIEGPKYWGL